MTQPPSDRFFSLYRHGFARVAVAVFALAPVWWVSFGPLCRWLFDEPAHGENG